MNARRELLFISYNDKRSMQSKIYNNYYQEPTYIITLYTYIN